MLHTIVEGEPGIFPEPVARLMRTIGGWFDRRKPAEPPGPAEPPEPAGPGADAPPVAGDEGSPPDGDDQSGAAG